MMRMRIPVVAAESACDIDDNLTAEEERILAELHALGEVSQWIKDKLPFLEENSGGEYLHQVLIREMERLRQAASLWRTRLGEATYRKHMVLGHAS